MAALAQREDFVSSVSHELRTPLTSVLGYLELASDDPTASESVRAHLRVAERNAERLLHLVADLLLAARTRERGVELDGATSSTCATSSPSRSRASSRTPARPAWRCGTT